jgi:hypothetical protein
VAWLVGVFCWVSHAVAHVPSEAAPIAIGLGLVLAVWVLLGVVLAGMNTILIVRRARGAALPWILVQAAIVMGMTMPLLISTFGERLHLSDAMDFVVQFTLIGWPILYPFALMGQLRYLSRSIAAR